MRPMGLIWGELLKAEEALKDRRLTDDARAEASLRLEGLREEMTAALESSAAEEEADEVPRDERPAKGDF